MIGSVCGVLVWFGGILFMLSFFIAVVGTVLMTVPKGNQMRKRRLRVAAWLFLVGLASLAFAFAFGGWKAFDA